MFKVFDFIAEGIGWVLIVASPTLIGLGTGSLIYFANPNLTRLILLICFTTFGGIIGIIWATRIWRKKGTVWFLSSIMATPDIDEQDKKENNDL